MYWIIKGINTTLFCLFIDPRRILSVLENECVVMVHDEHFSEDGKLSERQVRRWRTADRWNLGSRTVSEKRTVQSPGELKGMFDNKLLEVYARSSILIELS